MAGLRPYLYRRGIQMTCKVASAAVSSYIVPRNFKPGLALRVWRLGFSFHEMEKTGGELPGGQPHTNF